MAEHGTRTHTHTHAHNHRHTQPHLSIELHGRHAQADEAREEGLVQVGVFLEGHVLHHGRQLVVVAYQCHSLQPALPIHRFLHVRDASTYQYTRKYGWLLTVSMLEISLQQQPHEE